MSLVRSEECGCYWRSGSYGSPVCAKHSNKSYRPRGREFAFLLLRGGLRATAKGFGLIGLASLSAALAATPIWALALAGYGSAAFWIGMSYIAVAVATGVIWFVGLLYYTFP